MDGKKTRGNSGGRDFYRRHGRLSSIWKHGQKVGVTSFGNLNIEPIFYE